MVYTEICNAVWMYLWVGALLLAVILQCLVFMKKAWKHALELGLRPEQIKKGLTTGITISIMPTLPVLLVLLSLMPLLGVPLPWLRLSIIGSAYYETYAATTALECVGETMKLNENGLNDPTSLEAVLKQNTDKTNESEASTEETLSTSEYFYSMRLTKEQQDDKYVDDMKAITEDANASQESKDVANNALVAKAKMKDQESRVESEIRNKGYEDSLCMINDNGTVKVYVKVDDVLAEEDAATIKKIVEDITTLSDVDITSMK